MIPEIERMEMPDWLCRDNFKFNVYEVVNNSLYYPACGTDGTPVKYFMGNVYSFVYADYADFMKEYFYREISNPKCVRGYHIIHRESITPWQLIPNGWNVRIYPTESDGDPKRHINSIAKPYCEWIIFERDPDRDESYNPKRFSLLYIGGEGVATYQALYLSNRIKPKIVTVINPGTGFGLNWTDFRERNKIFGRTILYDKNLAPDYYASNQVREIWPEYSEEVVRIEFQRDDIIVVFKYTGDRD